MPFNLPKFSGLLEPLKVPETQLKSAVEQTIGFSLPKGPVEVMSDLMSSLEAGGMPGGLSLPQLPELPRLTEFIPTAPSPAPAPAATAAPAPTPPPAPRRRVQRIL